MNKPEFVAFAAGQNTTKKKGAKMPPSNKNKPPINWLEWARIAVEIAKLTLAVVALFLVA
ncbi:MAG: hypothetical protein ACR2PR_13060 [Pseudohongiellaceae bacterium]